MTFRRGEVVLVLFPDSNLRTAKRRLALVVQAENLGTGLAQTVVALVTSTWRRAGIPAGFRLQRMAKSASARHGARLRD